MHRKKSIKIMIIIAIVVAFLLIIVVGMLQNKSKFGNSKQQELYCKGLDEKLISRREDGAKYVRNELIIQTNDQWQKKDEKVFKKIGGKIVGYINVIGTYQIEFDEQIDEQELNKRKNMLESVEGIDSAKFNLVFTVSNCNYYPNDKYFKNQWEKDRTWGLTAINAPKAWMYLKSKDESKLCTPNIGIFECYSVDKEHKDLREGFGLEKGMKVNKTNVKDDKEKYEHGTAVAGIIGATFDNKLGICGVMPNVKLSSYSYFERKGSKEATSMLYTVGYCYLITKTDKEHTAIINNSLGANMESTLASNGIKAAENEIKEINDDIEILLKALLKEGYDFLLVKGSGNENGDGHCEYVEARKDDADACECGYVELTDKNREAYKNFYGENLADHVISGNQNAKYDLLSGITDPDIQSRIIVVGSMKKEDGTYKGSTYCGAGERVDVVAPGERITVLVSDNGYLEDSKLSSSYGTSYATPYVTGVAGLILTVAPDLSGSELKSIIKKTASGEYKVPLNNKVYTYPLVDAYAAVRAADSHKVYSQYKDAVTKCEKQYGSSKRNVGYLYGVCFLDLIDLDHDGIEELFLVYGENKEYEDYSIVDYKYMIYEYNPNGKDATKIEEGEIEPEEYSLDISVPIREKEDEQNYFIVCSHDDEGKSEYSVRTKLEDEIVEWASFGYQYQMNGDSIYYYNDEITSSEAYSNQCSKYYDSTTKYMLGWDGDLDLEFLTSVAKTENKTKKIKKLLGCTNEVENNKSSNSEKILYSKNDLYRIFQALTTDGLSEIAFYYDDFDGNGSNEAYGIVGNYQNGDISSCDNVKVYFISDEGRSQLVRDHHRNDMDLYGHLTMENLLEVETHKYLLWELDAGGSGSLTYIFGVKNGQPYEPEISGTLMAFATPASYMGILDTVSSGQYVGYKNDFSQGYHDYIPHYYQFDVDRAEFVEQKEN